MMVGLYMQLAHAVKCYFEPILTWQRPSSTLTIRIYLELMF